MNQLVALRLADAQGRWLDLGAGAGPSYARFLPSSLVRVPTDFIARPGVMDVDANQPLPFVDREFDGALAMNMLYTTEDPVAVLKEILRVVKPGGQFVATFPYVFPETPEPHDYHRWTKEGVERTLRSAGWSQVIVEPVGGLGTVLGSTMLPLRGRGIVQVCAAPMVALLDRVPSSFTYFWFARATA